MARGMAFAFACMGAIGLTIVSIQKGVDFSTPIFLVMDGAIMAWTLLGSK